jgi:hypothetical protein
MNMPVTAENLDAAKPESEKVVRQLFEQEDGTVQAGPEEITAADKPGLRIRATGTLDGTPYETTIVFIFDGTTEYYLDCQSTAEWAEEIERGCQQIVRTFSVETGSTVAPPVETSVPVVPCSDPHGYEIFAAVNLPDGTSLATMRYSRRQPNFASRSSKALSGCPMRNRCSTSRTTTRPRRAGSTATAWSLA